MKKVAFILFAILPVVLYAQLETTLPAMSRLHQASYYNPAILPEYSYSLSTPVFPGLNIGLGLEGISGSTVLKNIDNDGLIDLRAVHNDIKGDHIAINVFTNTELFHLRFKSNNWYYGINLNTRSITNLSLSKDFLGLVINGNQYFAGRTADLSSTRINVVGFSELGFSMARSYKRWNMGGRVKFLHGSSAVSTSGSSITLYTPAETTGEVGLSMNGTINTSGVPILMDSVNNEKVSDDEKDFDAADMYSFKNLGASLDLGCTYDVNNFLTVGAAVSDLGFIRWTNKTVNYNQNDLKINYGGLPYESVDDDSLATAYGDSLLKLLEGSVSRNSFTTWLPTRFMLSGTYRLNNRNSIGAMVQGYYYWKHFVGAYTVSYTRKTRLLDFTANYSIVGRNFANIGLGLAAKAGVAQFYLVQDNILGYFIPQQTQLIHLRLGVNFVWGEIKRPLKVY